MINEAQVCLSGYVAAQPIFRKLDSGTSFTKLRVAYTERRLNRETGEWSDGPTTFLGVQCFRRLAENVASSLRKGEPVIVRGRLFTRRFTNGEGQERSVLEVDASSIGHDLSRGVAIFSRTRKAAGETAAENTAAAGMEGGERALSLDGAEPAGEDREPDSSQAGQFAPQDQPGLAAGAPEGAAIVDESAVAEFARELDESLAADGAAAVG